MIGLTNLYTDPNAIKKQGAWNGDATQASDGIHWTYTLREGQSNGTVGFVPPNGSMDLVFVLMTDNPNSYVNGVENAKTILEKNNVYIAAKTTNTGNKAVSLQRGPVTVLGVAYYSDEDEWNKIKSLYDSGIIPSPVISNNMPITLN